MAHVCAYFTILLHCNSNIHQLHMTCHVRSNVAHLVEMLHIIRTRRLLQLLSESSHILGKGLVVQILDPVVSASTCGGVLLALANSIPRSRCRCRLVDRDRDGLGRAPAAAAPGGDVGAGGRLGWGEGTDRRRR